jgi:hypothetical protein
MIVPLRNQRIKEKEHPLAMGFLPREELKGLIDSVDEATSMQKIF